MIKYPEINPIMFQLGPLKIHWYAFFYILSFFLGYILVKRFLKYRKVDLKKDEYENMIFYIMLGVIVGGRLGYVLFYNLGYYISNPLEAFLPFEFGNGIKFVGFSGMSFHGGALGVIISGFLFCKKNNKSFFQLADVVTPIVAIGLGLGRIGNFMNAELYGRVTSVPWGMIFPNSDGLPRHPSQLYEAFSEGLLLFCILYVILRKTSKNGVVFWSFIGFYGLFRFLIEFVREPDAHLGFIFSFMTMGQILSSFMIISSIIAIILINKWKKHDASD